jgi:hypothetical protein
VLVVRRILTTFLTLVMLSGYLSESHGNIIVFPGVSNQPQIFDLDSATDFFQQAVSLHQAPADVGPQSAPAPIQPTEPQPDEPVEWWLTTCQGMGSAPSFRPIGGGAGQAALGAHYKFFLAQPLSWLCCGEKLIFPATPIENFLKVPILGC